MLADRHGRPGFRAHREIPVLGADRHAAPAEAHAHLEASPLRRQVRVDLEPSGARPDAGKPEHERLPQAAHRRDVQTERRRSRQVVEIDSGRDVERLEGVRVVARPREQGCVNRRRK